MAVLCSTCGTELDLPPGPPPRQVRCPICRAVMDTDLARRVEAEPDPLPAAEPLAPARPYRTSAPSSFPLGLVLLVGGGLVTVGTGLLFLLFIAVVAEADRAAPRPAAPPPVMVRQAEVPPVGGNPPRPVVVGPGRPVPPRAPQAVDPRPPQFQPPRPVAPPPPPAPRPAPPRW